MLDHIKLFINGQEIQEVKALEYKAPVMHYGVSGFMVEAIATINWALGNVEHIKVLHDDEVVAEGWAIVRREHLHYWTFLEVVSYSPVSFSAKTNARSNDGLE